MSEPARGIVLRYLCKAEAAGQYTNLTLDTALRREELSVADKRLVTALFYSVVEHRVTLDAVIDGLSSLPPSKIESVVRQDLRLALAQLLYFDRIPDHAAIDEAVKLCPKRSKGFVNALLRQFCRNGKAVPLPERGTPSYLSVRYSVSLPLAQRFRQIFGEARAESVLAAFSVPPAITVRVNTVKGTREEFLAGIPGAIPTKNAPFGVILPANTEPAPLVGAGVCFVQDEASQIAVAALDVRPGMRVLDLCAAPGSKSFGAAMDLKNTGNVMSFDLHENKISLIRRGAGSLGLSCLYASAADARTLTPASPGPDGKALGRFERVICDVPCSGFGVLWKKPDLRYKDPADTAGLPPIQRDILQAASAMVAPGGVLIYATCTLLPEENEEQIKAFLKGHPEFAPAPFAVGNVVSDGCLTMTPDETGTDGFFVAKLTRL